MYSVWWTSLETFEKVFWIIALPFSLAFVIQIILTFFSVDAEADADLDIDAEIDTDQGAGYQFFTIKNLIAFFTIFGWTGIACIDGGLGRMTTVSIAFIAGMVMMAIMTMIVFFTGKLSYGGSSKM
ncbi:MAG: hypothetical protein ACI8ZN_000887 [Bacteroidia bacterium]|jgi:hypothetical protein